MKTIQEIYESIINEGNDYGIDFDPKASLYKNKYATQPLNPKKYSWDISHESLKEFKILKGDVSKFNSMVNKGLKVIQDFVKKTDFNKYAEKNDIQWKTNFEDKAFIYYSLTGWLGGYSQYKLSRFHIASIGISNSINDFIVKNQNVYHGATEPFGELRPQLILVPSYNHKYYIDIVIKEIPALKQYLYFLYDKDFI